MQLHCAKSVKREAATYEIHRLQNRKLHWHAEMMDQGLGTGKDFPACFSPADSSDHIIIDQKVRKQSSRNSSLPCSSSSKEQLAFRNLHKEGYYPEGTQSIKPVPGALSLGMQDIRTSQLPEDMSRYPSTVSGHIAPATRDDRFVDATGPYHMVPLEEFKRITDSESSRLITAESRDPTFSSFEAFILAPSTSSFTLYDKQKSTANNDIKESAGAKLVADEKSESKSIRTVQSSPLKNQVKSSVDSRCTLTFGKQSFDTVRSGPGMADMSESGSRRDQYVDNLFTHIQESDSSRLDKIRGQSSESGSQSSSSSNPSSPTSVTLKARRQILELSVNPVSPFVVSSHALETSVRHSPIDSYRKLQKLETGAAHVSPPGSDRTIKSFSAIHRPSNDVSLIVEENRGRMTSLGKIEETPTKTSKRSPAGTEYYALPQKPISAALSIPSPRPHPRIKLVGVRPASMFSDSGIPRVNSAYLDDQDMVRLEARESDQNKACGIEGAAGNRNIASGYWDYSIVTGVGGSPPRDYTTLLRNASVWKNFSNVSEEALQQETSTSFHKPGASDSLLGKPVKNVHYRDTRAPRSSSDKSLTSSFTDPDNADELSEKGKCNGKRRARHTKRRGNRPPSMASLAAPLGEDLVADVASRELARDADASALHDNAKDNETENQRLVQTDIEKDAIRVPTPEESSFGQSLAEVTIDIGNGALFTRFGSSPVSTSTARQIQQFKALPPVFHFPSPPASQKHSSLLSDILAVTRDSYQGRKESSRKTDGDYQESDVAVPVTSTPELNFTQDGRTYRSSVVGGRTRDPALHIIHEDEAPPRFPQLNSESLRELDRRVAAGQVGSTPPTHSVSLPNLETRAADRGTNVAYVARAIGCVPVGGQTVRRGSLDNLSLATTTTVRPSFHTTQPRQIAAVWNDSGVRRTVRNQPSRTLLPLVPVGRDRITHQQGDELPEGTYGDRTESSMMCICFGRRLW